MNDQARLFLCYLYFIGNSFEFHLSAYLALTYSANTNLRAVSDP